MYLLGVGCVGLQRTTRSVALTQRKLDPYTPISSLLAESSALAPREHPFFATSLRLGREALPYRLFLSQTHLHISGTRSIWLIERKRKTIF